MKHNSKSTVLFIFLFTFILSSSYSSPPPQNLSVAEIAKLASPSVVEMSFYCQGDEPTVYATGFYVAPNKILTCAHALENIYAPTVWVETADSVEDYDVARLLKIDEKLDLALLEIETLDRPHLELAPEKSYYIGQRIVTLGYPLYLGETVSEGLISSLDPTGRHLVHSAIMSGGNSGSPILNLEGRVIGTSIFFITRKTYEIFAIRRNPENQKS